MLEDDIRQTGEQPGDRGDAIRRALAALRESHARIEELERARSEPIAIVGMACRLPGADGPEAFWSLLDEGRCAIGEIPPDRWNIDDWYDADADAPGRMYTRHGGFIDGIDQFDAELFGINPREAAALDPQHRLLLETAWWSLEHAGVSPLDGQGSPTGVFVGISYSDYARLLDRSGDTDPYILPGTSLNAAAGRISYTLGFRGPSVAFDTACSSSLVAVHNAVQSLRLGECDLALAGGVNALLAPEMFVLACKARMLSPSGLCHTFDQAADGFVRGEGCGFVALRRLSDAQARGERILAVVRGSAVNQDGRTSGLTAPSGAAQAEVIRRALAQAGLTPADIDVIEAHGTGTKLGDPIEMGALAAVFGDGQRKAPLVVGSAKTNLGHLESAAGVTGLIKAVLSLVNGRVPAHLHLNDPNPYIPWADLPIHVPTTAQSWSSAEGRPRRAGVSSFGFSGTNAHLIVEEAPAFETAETGNARDHLLILSARTQAQLRDEAVQWAAHLNDTGVTAADACRVAATGRARFRERLVADGRSTGELAGALRDGQTDTPGITLGSALDDPGGIAFLCSGQGSQRAGMGLDLYNSLPVVRELFDRAADVLSGELDKPLLEVMFGDDEALTETAYTQPALYVVSVALAAAWRDWGIRPVAVLGHSIGEYAAAHLAGVFGFEDGLRLVAARGRLMQGLAERGAMAAVQAPAEIVEAAIRDHGGDGVSFACRNAPLSQVISGRAEAVEAVSERLKGDGRKVKALRVSHAFHSIVMEPMLDAFAKVLDGVPMSPPTIPLATNADGAVAGRDLATPEYWLRHTRNTVRFQDGMATLRELGCHTFIEVGPGSTLAGLAESCAAETDPPARYIPSLGRKNLGDGESFRKAAAELFVAGHEPDWTAINGPGRVVTMPGCTFARKRHWLPKTATAPRASDMCAEAGPSLFRVAWKPVAANTTAKVPGRWIVADAGDPEFCMELAGALTRRGADTEVSPVSRIDMDGLRQASGLIVAGPLPDEAKAVEQALSGPYLELAQQVIAAAGPRLWIVTEGAETTGHGEETSRPGAAALAGFGKVIGLETDTSWGGLVDRDRTASADAVVDAILSSGGEDRIALRGSERLIARLETVPLPQDEAPMRLRGDGIHLVTGGTGALGLCVVDWLAERGARDIAIISRRGTSPAAVKTAERLEGQGIRVRMIPCDMGDEAAVRSMIGGFDKPIRGVVHAAGTVSQAEIPSETPAGMRAVLAAKTRGAWTLHEATSEADLDLFVMFSSIAALWGSKGQCAYAAANRYLDGLADLRRSLGLKALSVNWGPWGGGGMADSEDAAWLMSSGLRLLQPGDALAALDRALDADVSRIGVGEIDWPTFAPLYAHRGGRLLDEMTEEEAEETADTEERPALVAELIELVPRRRIRHLGEFIRQQAAVLLGTGMEKVPGNKGFFEAGMDSFLQVELRGKLAASLGVSLPPTVALEHHTADLLARHILTDKLGLSCGDEAEKPAPKPEDAGATPAPDIRHLGEDELMALIDGQSLNAHGPGR